MMFDSIHDAIGEQLEVLNAGLLPDVVGRAGRESRLDHVAVIDRR